MLGIHRLDQIRRAHHLAHLVGLQMADEMQRGRAVGPGGPLFHQLLHPVFAEYVNACVPGGAHGVCGLGLAGGAQLHRFGRTPGGTAGFLHAAAHLGGALGQLFMQFVHCGGLLYASA